MSEDKYLYGIEKSFHGIEFKMSKTKIVKETPKTFKVESAIGAYGYLNRVLKDNPDLARTEDEAIRVFVRNAQSRISDLESEIAHRNKDIAQVEKLLEARRQDDEK